MKENTNRTIVLLVGSIAGAVLLSIVVAGATYFTLQYATENQVQAQKATVAPAIKTQEGQADELAQTGAVSETRANTSRLLPMVTPVAEPAHELAMASRIVPAGWVDYQIVDSGVTFAYPPHWDKAEEDTNSVTFAPQISQTILVVAAKDGSFIQIMGDGSTEMLKRGVLTFTPEDVDITFRDEGILAAPYRPAYVTTLMYVDGDPASSLITYATDGRQVLLILLLNNGLSSVSEPDFAMVTQLVQSVSFDRGISGSTNAGQETLNLLPAPTTLPTSTTMEINTLSTTLIPAGVPASIPAGANIPAPKP